MVAGRRVGVSRHLAGIVDSPAIAKSAAGQRSQVRHQAASIKKRVLRGAWKGRVSGDVAVLADAVGQAARAARRSAQIGDAINRNGIRSGAKQ